MTTVDQYPVISVTGIQRHFFRELRVVHFERIATGPQQNRCRAVHTDVRDLHQIRPCTGIHDEVLWQRLRTVEALHDQNVIATPQIDLKMLGQSRQRDGASCVIDRPPLDRDLDRSGLYPRLERDPVRFTGTRDGQNPLGQ